MKITTATTKKTYSVCPVCLARIPARLIQRGGNWYMEKTCEQHGKFSAVVWRGSAPDLKKWGNYHPPKEQESELPDCPKDCGLCEKHLQNTCCVLVEVTERCNLECPICFAQSTGSSIKPEKSISELFEDFQFLIDKGCKFIQLSGGEPTVRDDLPEIVKAAKQAGATSVQLNSNGLRLGREPEYTKRLAAAGLDFVFLQFDGTDDEPYKVLRGRPLLSEKLEAIRICGENGIGVTLVPTIVPGINDHQIGKILTFGIKKSPVVRGVHFQPVSYFGRYPEPPKDENRITLPEIISAIEAQTEGMIRQSDLAPSACDHPRCGFHGDFMIMPDRLISLIPKEKNDSGECCCKPSGEAPKGRNDEALRNRNFVARRWKRNLDLEREAVALNRHSAAASCCGPTVHTEADGTDITDGMETMDFDTFLARIAANGFTVTAMAFQDAYNLDMERLRRCSLHVYEDGRIIPFCAKYLTGTV